MDHPLAAQFAKEHAAHLEAMLYEQMPNEFRNLPRLPAAEIRRAPITRASGVTRMTPRDWSEIWGIDLFRCEGL